MPAASAPLSAGIAPSRAPGNASVVVWPSKGFIAISDEPNPYALRSVTWSFGPATCAWATYIRAACRRIPDCSAAVPARTPGLSARNTTGSPNGPTTSRNRAALSAASRSIAPALHRRVVGDDRDRRPAERTQRGDHRRGRTRAGPRARHRRRPGARSRPARRTAGAGRPERRRGSRPAGGRRRRRPRPAPGPTRRSGSRRGSGARGPARRRRRRRRCAPRRRPRCGPPRRRARPW